MAAGLLRMRLYSLTTGPERMKEPKTPQDHSRLLGWMKSKAASFHPYLPGPDHRRSFLHLQAALRAACSSWPAIFLLFAFGWLVIAWALADLLMNLARIFYHLAGMTSPLEYCTVAQAGRLFKRPGLFLAIDTLISFSIICFALWSGWITNLSRMDPISGMQPLP